jgi:hypothetical protein
LGDQAIGAHRVIEFADVQSAPWMRFGKRPLHLRFAIAVKDHATKHEDKNRDGKNDRTKAKANSGQEPARRQPPAILPRSFMNDAL